MIHTLDFQGTHHSHQRVAMRSQHAAVPLPPRYDIVDRELKKFELCRFFDDQGYDLDKWEPWIPECMGTVWFEKALALYDSHGRSIIEVAMDPKPFPAALAPYYQEKGMPDNLWRWSELKEWVEANGGDVESEFDGEECEHSRLAMLQVLHCIQLRRAWERERRIDEDAGIQEQERKRRRTEDQKKLKLQLGLWNTPDQPTAIPAKRSRSDSGTSTLPEAGESSKVKRVHPSRSANPLPVPESRLSAERRAQVAAANVASILRELKTYQKKHGS